MSTNKKVEITCPTCANTYDFDYQSSVNATTDPNKKAMVLDYTIFQTSCPYCKQRYLYSSDFFYHDMNDKYMIALMPNLSDGDIKNYNDLFLKEINSAKIIADNYRLRVVSSHEDLVEKIQLFNDKLDDRIVEIYKCFWLLKQEENLPPIEELLSIRYFSKSEELAEALLVLEYSDEKNNCSYIFSNELYTKLVENIPNERLKGEYPAFNCYDAKWAQEYFIAE